MTRFYKLSGSGNDFLALAEPWDTPPPERIRAWCRRGVSLGADGLFILRRAEGGATMDYFNADGLAADLCLNGARCAAQLAFHLGWAEGSEGPRGPRGTLRLRTGAGTVVARRLDDGSTAVEIPAPAAPPQPLTVEVGGTSHAGWRILVGVPHFVLIWPDNPGNSLETAPVVELGRQLRHHSVFGDPGTNVNFVRFPDRERMEIRTYERGVEDETLSCGTGTLAGAAVGLILGRSRLPLKVDTRSGFELLVDGDPETGGWSLAGDARVVAEGEILPGAAANPSPPAWMRDTALLQT
ncbi:MAG: diaminopimelate epimerase [Acidobacteriota bacterium]|jgi:diaminopimelate epimerase|nr:diaminopimelate epimerase [Acidobacteriota bacterium]